MPADTIPARLVHQGEVRGDLPAWFTRDGEDWRAVTLGEVAAQVRLTARALVAAGLCPGERVAIVANNRPEWVGLELATWLSCGVVVALPPQLDTAALAGALALSGARFVLIEDEDLIARVEAAGAVFPESTRLILPPGQPPTADPRVLDWAAFLSLAADSAELDVDALLEALSPEQPAVVLFPFESGEVSRPVVLRHGSLCWAADRMVELAGLGPGDSGICALPLATAVEQVHGVLAPISAASAVYFPGPGRLSDQLVEIQPTVVLGTPRLWERVVESAELQSRGLKGLSAILLRWARHLAAGQTARRNAGRMLGPVARLARAVADRLVFRTLSPRFGLGAARVCLGVDGPARPGILRRLGELQIEVHELFGDVESLGIATANRPGATRFGTMGKPSAGVEISVSTDGEILLRGPDLRAEAGREVAEGREDWRATGYLGGVESDGVLVLLARKSEIIVTADGHSVAPRLLEAAIEQIPLVDRALVVGDQRPYLAALLALDPDALARFAAQHGLPATDLHNREEVRAAIDEALAQLESEEEAPQVRRFELVPSAFTVEAGELMPSLELRREVVHRHWAHLIEQMYQA